MFTERHVLGLLSCPGASWVSGRCMERAAAQPSPHAGIARHRHGARRAGWTATEMPASDDVTSNHMSAPGDVAGPVEIIGKRDLLAASIT